VNEENSKRSQGWGFWEVIKGMATPVLIGIALFGLGYLLWRAIPLTKGGVK